jgi:hypothetical protein
VTHPSPSVARDERGAILVLGVFMAALLVGFLYFVTGIGDAIVHRERMQDAADSAAFAGATTHARGMNMIAMVNVSTTGVLATVAGVKVAHTFVAARTISLAVRRFAGQRRGLVAVRDRARVEDTRLSRPLLAVLRAGNTAANAVATAIPLAAQSHVMLAAIGAYQPTVDAAIPYPTFRRLPVEDSTLDDLIGRASPAAVPLVAPPFRPFSVAMGFLSVQSPAAIAAQAAIAGRAILAPVPPATALFMVPQALSGTVILGGERLQIRVAVGGRFDFSLSERGLEVATWGDSEATDENQEGLAALGNVALAQAEYFYGGGEPRAEWLWTQRWLARLRRVRVDAPQPCTSTSIDCVALDDLFTRGFDQAAVH